MSGRARALFEAFSLSFIAVSVSWFFEAYLKWWFFWDWSFKAVLLLMALLAVVIPGRSLRVYGFLPPNPRLTLKWSLLIIVVFTLPAMISIVVFMVLGMSGPVELSPLRLLRGVIWFMVFIGLIEEAFFRGYVQSRLDEVFERRWRRLVFKSWRVDYGAGLLIASAVFAVAHIVNYWNPLVSRWEPGWWIPIHIFWCFVFGCIAGALREASGDIYVPASLHGGVMTAYALLSAYTNLAALNITLFTSWFIFFYIIVSFFKEAGRLEGHIPL